MFLILMAKFMEGNYRVQLETNDESFHVVVKINRLLQIKYAYYRVLFKILHTPPRPQHGTRGLAPDTDFN